jgi:predicted site-specific integrase-resolvase
LQRWDWEGYLQPSRTPTNRRLISVCSAISARRMIAVWTMYNDSLSPEHEIVQEMLSLVHGFSARLDGLRHYRKA